MSRRTEKCPACKGAGLITVDDWLIKGMTEEELAKEKEEALADIVEVVRCKDCLYFKRSTSALFPQASVYICDNAYGLKGNVAESDYCSYGERREECSSN